MVKSSKQFLMSNETANSYGFNVKTDGIDLSQFYRNPIMLWMHKRHTGSKNDVLPLGHWENITVTGTSIYGTPVFDDSDAFAKSIYTKVESGVIRMASAGLKPVQWDQNGKVLSRSIMEECSIVDIGANGDALAVALYNEHGGTINLSTLKVKDSYIQHLNSLSYDELDLIGKLEHLREKDPDSFAKKYNEKYGFWPKGFEQQNGHSPFALKLFDKSYDELFYSDELLKLKQLAPDLYKEKHLQKYGQYPKN